MRYAVQHCKAIWYHDNKWLRMKINRIVLTLKHFLRLKRLPRQTPRSGEIYHYNHAHSTLKTAISIALRIVLVGTSIGCNTCNVSKSILKTNSKIHEHTLRLLNLKTCKSCWITLHITTSYLDHVRWLCNVLLSLLRGKTEFLHLPNSLVP